MPPSTIAQPPMTAEAPVVRRLIHAVPGRGGRRTCRSHPGRGVRCEDARPDVALDDVGDRLARARPRAPLGRRRRAPRLARVRRVADPDVALGAVAQSPVMRSKRSSYPRNPSTSPGERWPRSDAAVFTGRRHWNSEEPSSNGVHWLGSTTKVRYPYRARSSSSITSRVQQSDQVRARARPRTGVGERLLERACAAELVARVRARAPTARPGQVGGGGEPVVAAADDHHVPAAGGELRQGSGQADPPDGGGHRGSAHPVPPEA